MDWVLATSRAALEDRHENDKTSRANLKVDLEADNVSWTALQVNQKAGEMGGLDAMTYG